MRRCDMGTLWHEVVLGLTKEEAIDLVYGAGLSEFELEQLRPSFNPIIERTYTYETIKRSASHLTNVL